MDCTTAAIVFIKSVDSYRPLPAKRACPFIRAGMFDHGTASEKAFRPSFALGLVVFQPFGQLFRHGRILRLSASFLPCKIIAHIVLVAGRLSPSFLEGRHLFPVSAHAGEHLLFAFTAQLKFLVAVGTARIGNLQRAPAITALPVRTDQHFPSIFCLHPQKVFPAIRARCPRHILMRIGFTACFDLIHQS